MESLQPSAIMTATSTSVSSADEARKEHINGKLDDTFLSDGEKGVPSEKNEADTKGAEEEANAKSGDGAGFKAYLRVFTYNDTWGWVMNAIAFIGMIGAGVILPLMDVIFGKFVNVFNDFANGTMSPAGYRSQVSKYSLYFVYLFFAKFGLTYIWTVLISITAIRTTKKLRITFLQQILRQDIPFFDSPSSSVSGQISTNGNLINNGISEKLGLTIQALSTFVSAFIVAFAVQWKLTLIVIAIVPVNIIVTWGTVAVDMKWEYQMFDIYSESGSLAEEAFSSIRTAHAFWAFPKLTKRFDAILDRARKIGMKKSLAYAIMFPTEFFCIFSGYALAFWQGLRMYRSGEIPQPGTVVTVIFAVLVAAQALTQFAPQTIALSKAAAAAAELFAIIDRESKVDSLSESGREIPSFSGDIKLRNVRFAYPSRSDVPVLHGLDLDIPSSKMTALVGASGSGKSTIFGLLERWYLPEKGSNILLDDQPIEELNLRWLRTNIRLVQQEPTLFSGTILQNVVDGLSGTDKTDLPEDEKRTLVIEACKAAYAHDFIEELPNGYETFIGERGASLSGGQKQRIVIARSIISNPKVLLLDEATSALDPNAEKIVQQALNNVAKGRTIVAIAHRLSTIRDADNIVVISKGEKVEEGTHDELIKLGGSYAKLVQTQDLGKGDKSSEKEEYEEKVAEGAALEAAITSASGVVADQVVVPSEDRDDISYGLFHCLWLVLKENRYLWMPFGLNMASCVAGGITFPALAILFSKTMDAFQTINVGQGNFYSLMFFVVALGNLFAYAVTGWTSNLIGQHVMRVYRGELFDSTLRQPMSFFDNPNNPSGALVSKLSSEPTSMQELLSINLSLLMIAFVNAFSSSILAIAFGWKLGLTLALGALPVLIFAGYVRIRLEFRFEDDTADRFAASSGLASEAVMAIRTVSSLALERSIVERFHASLQGIAKHAIAGMGWKMLFYSISQSVSFLAMALGFWYGGNLVSRGEYTNTQFYTVFIAVIFGGEAAASMFTYTTSISKARSAINYVFKQRRHKIHFDTAASTSGADRDDGGDIVEVKEGKGSDMSCNDINFAYPLRPNLRVIKGIDVQIPSGKMVAFVGASGCGKSTMIALLERFYDPTTGSLTCDGQDLRSLDRRRYRGNVSLVQQEPVLYQGSIKDNISLGVEDVNPTDDQIILACQQANIWTFISSLPEGLHTPCGNQGLSLSGGQRQRIALARALVRSPRLLLLDEATSALDTESEKVVKEALDKAAEGRTTVAVAHRLSTVRDADLIVVFRAGRVVERGTHGELIGKRGVYYEMVLGQSLDKETT